MNFVTVDDAREHLQIGDDSHDAWLATWIPSASAMIRNYMQGHRLFEVEIDTSGNPVLDTNGDPVIATDTNGVPLVRFEVRAATLIMLGYLFRQRDEDEHREFEMGYLPRPVTAILYPLRDPAIA